MTGLLHYGGDIKSIETVKGFEFHELIKSVFFTLSMCRPDIVGAEIYLSDILKTQNEIQQLGDGLNHVAE